MGDGHKGASMELKFKKLLPEVKIPQRANPTDAGLDLTAISVKYDVATATYHYDTGLAVAIPEGFVGLLFPRSSIYRTDLSLRNSVGVIDSAYRGPIGLKFLANGTTHYNVGDRVGQLVIVPIILAEPVEVDDLDETSRGSGSFGSSGV